MTIAVCNGILKAGIKGAESIASVIWLARNGHSKEEIKEYVIAAFPIKCGKG